MTIESEEYPRPEWAAHWISLVLDQIDYGVIVVTSACRLLFANDSARRMLRGDHPLRIDGPHLLTRHAGDMNCVRRALVEASGQGLRTLLTLGDDDAHACAAVVPIPAAGMCDEGAVLVVIGKEAVCEELSVQGYARVHGLTLAESQVLRLLCAGALPSEIALVQGVSISTIRTQIGSIRAKTRTRSIGALVHQVAVLPPLVNALPSRAFATAAAVAVAVAVAA